MVRALEPGVGELLAHRGAQYRGMLGGESVGGLRAGRVEHEAEVRAVTTMASLRAMAGGAAAVGVVLSHGSGAKGPQPLMLARILAPLFPRTRMVAEGVVRASIA